MSDFKEILLVTVSAIMGITAGFATFVLINWTVWQMLPLNLLVVSIAPWDYNGAKALELLDILIRFSALLLSFGVGSFCIVFFVRWFLGIKDNGTSSE